MVETKTNHLRNMCSKKVEKKKKEYSMKDCSYIYVRFEHSSIYKYIFMVETVQKKQIIEQQTTHRPLCVSTSVSVSSLMNVA